MRSGNDAMSRGGLGIFATRVLVVLLLAGLVYVAWTVAPLLILGFGGLLLAVLLRAGGEAVARALPLSPRWGVVLVVVTTAAVVVALAWLFGSMVLGQLGDLASTLDTSFDRVRRFAESHGLGHLVPSGENGVSVGLASQAMTALGTAGNILAGVLVILFVALYLAVSPEVYRRGALLLIPPRHHERAREVMGAVGTALLRWMLGQLVSMVTIGILVTAALSLLNVPLALVLGVTAGVLEFVPILGPWLAAVPAALVALTVGPQTAGLVLAVYVAIQQVESYLITPMAERWALSLPPAMAVVAAMAFTLLFGFIGLLFAVPITISLMVIVRMVYVRDTLGARPSDENRMPG